MILDLFKNIKECHHPKIRADQEKAYCPDCGAYVETKWYLTRCKCCNIKRVSYNKFNKISPVEKYCPNCGSKEFYLEELDGINFIDINFAVMRKEVIEDLTTKVKSQIWVDIKNGMQQGLLELS
ncbi:MAG: hypothetical protein PHV37_09730 [Candidatus Gastranaerophilales bacterium]|nr:hypothetical protein [Candidatus Gastranaerophilales bacterium]